MPESDLDERRGEGAGMSADAHAVVTEYAEELLDAPRYPNGPENHGSTSMDWKSNGDQWYGRQTFWGGGENYGFRVGYGERAGSDYRTGSTLEMPTSYHSRDWDVAHVPVHCVAVPGDYHEVDTIQDYHLATSDWMRFST